MLSDTRDRQLPQRGDQPRFAVDVDTGLYVNKGYSCTSDGVRGGILELMPLEGVQFIHRDWNIVKSCRPRDVSRHDKQQSSHPGQCLAFRWTCVITLAEYPEQLLSTEEVVFYFVKSFDVTKAAGYQSTIWSEWKSCGLHAAEISPNLQTSEIATRGCESTTNGCN